MVKERFYSEQMVESRAARVLTQYATTYRIVIGLPVPVARTYGGVLI